MGSVSGAHLNPLVSLADALLGGLCWRQVGAYVSAQVSGAVLGAVLRGASESSGRGSWLLTGEGLLATGLQRGEDGLGTAIAEPAWRAERSSAAGPTSLTRRRPRVTNGLEAPWPYSITFAYSADIMDGGRPAGGSTLTLEDLVNDCLAAARRPDGARAVAEVLRRAVSRPQELESAVGPAGEAGDTTLFASPQLTVSRLVWAPGMSMYPHDHRMWTVIAVYRGAERNLLYRRSGGSLVTADTLELGSGQVAVLDADAIHAVLNPLDDLSAALHVFGGDFEHQPRSEWDWETLSERPYDDERAQQLFRAANARGGAGQAVTENGGPSMRLRLIHDEDGQIISFVPPGTELTGPQAPGQRISEVEAPDLDANELDVNRLRERYRVSVGGEPPRLVPRELGGTPTSGAGRPTERSATFPPGPT